VSDGPKRRRLNSEVVLETAVQLCNGLGPEQLSLALLAQTLGVKPPSLYNHIASLEALIRLLCIEAIRQLGQCLQAAAVGLAGRQALWAIAKAQRDFARRQPGLYRLTWRSYEDDPALQAASKTLLTVVLAVLAGYGLHGSAAIHAARALRASIGGFVLLEQSAGFGLPLDVDESFERLLQMLDVGLSAQAAKTLG
jgi:AcrR family transcriptional regulator